MNDFITEVEEVQINIKKISSEPSGFSLFDSNEQLPILDLLSELSTEVSFSRSLTRSTSRTSTRKASEESRLEEEVIQEEEIKKEPENHLLKQ